jgi:uncharacterized protein YqjF (DUF2071 family)
MRAADGPGDLLGLGRPQQHRTLATSLYAARVRFETTVRDLLLATWNVPAERIERALPDGVEPALTDEGRALVSLVGLRNTAVRAAGHRVPSFSQLNVRTYVTGRGESAVFLLSVRVTPPGLGGIAFGLPVRPLRIAVRAGSVVAKGAGARIRYRVIGEARSVPAAGGTPLGTHGTALFVSAGLRRLVAHEHEGCAWHEAELLEPALVEPVVALGFDVGEPDSLLYASETRFAFDLPPERVL